MVNTGIHHTYFLYFLDNFKQPTLTRERLRFTVVETMGSTSAPLPFRSSPGHWVFRIVLSNTPLSFGTFLRIRLSFSDDFIRIPARFRNHPSCTRCHHAFPKPTYYTNTVHCLFLFVHNPFDEKLKQKCSYPPGHKLPASKVQTWCSYKPYTFY